MIEVGKDLQRSPGPSPAQAETPKAGCPGIFEYFQAWRLQNLSGQPLASFSVRQAAPWSTSILRQSNFPLTFTFHWPNNAGILIKLEELNKKVTKYTKCN